MAPTVMCCCVFPLRRGCVLIGAILTTLYALTSLALAGTAIYYWLYDYLGYRRVPDRLPPPVRHRRPIALAVAAGMALLCLVFHVLLLVGARRDRTRLLLAWLVFNGLVFSGHLAGLAVGFVTSLAIHDWGLLAGVVALTLLQALLWHWFLVVRAQYLQLQLKTPGHRGSRGSAAEDAPQRSDQDPAGPQQSRAEPAKNATEAENSA